MAFGDDVTVRIGGDNSGLRSTISSSRSEIDALGATVGNNMGSWRDFQFTLGSVGESLLDNIGPLGGFLIGLNSLFGVVTTIVTPIKEMVDGVISFGEHLAELAVNVGWDALREGLDLVQNLAQQMFQLDEATQQNVFNWQFLYGGQQNAGALAAWTQQFSMKIPYTRQDLLSAITRLGSQGFDVSQVEQYMPIISDIASTQGKPGLSLAWATQAVVEAMMGRSYMLKQDLNINPALLQSKFGYDPSNPASLLPALEAYSKSRGEYGASQKVATQTFWGAWSSMQDRLQNFLMGAGGMNPQGQVGKGSFFGNLQKELNDLASFLDNHKDALTQLEGIISKLFGAGVQTGATAVTDFFKALHATGLDTSLEQDLSTFADWLANPRTQQGIGQFAGMLGQLAGVAGTNLRGIFEGFWNGLTGSGIGQTLLNDIQGAVKWLSDPQHQQQLRDLANAIGTTLGGSLQQLAGDLKDVANQLTTFMNHLSPQDIYNFQVAIYTTIEVMSAFLNLLMGFVTLTYDLSKEMWDLQNGDFAAAGVDAVNAHSDYEAYKKSQQDAMSKYISNLGSAYLKKLAGDQSQKDAQDAGKKVSDAVVKGIHGNLGHVASATQRAMDIMNETVKNNAQTIGLVITDGIVTSIQDSLKKQMQQDALWGNLQWRRPGGNQAHGNIF